MEVLIEALRDFISGFDGATIGAWLLASTALYKANLANVRQDERPKHRTSSGADKTSNDI